jgi:hypothetical protein
MQGRVGGMANFATDAPQIDPLRELQKAFCLFQMGGDVWVGDLAGIEAVKAGTSSCDVAMYKQTAGKLLMERRLEELPVSSNARQVVKDFLVSPNTKVFDAVAFSPLPTPTSTLNYWVGSPVLPQAGDWSVIMEYLRDVICSADRRLLSYLIRYLTHMLQKPEEKPGIMIVLLGGQGTGKGSLFRLLKAIWRHTTLQVSDVAHVIGNFNAAIERNYVICMDEALFSGDKKALDRLKSMVTEPTVTIEQKYQPRRTINSYHRFFAASNHKHFAQVEADDRRFVFFQVSEARKGDHAYWDNVHKAIDDPAVIAAMVHEMLSLDINNFNVRQRPKTEAHMDQRLKSLSGFDRYWLEVLQTGCFWPGGRGEPMEPWEDPRFVSTKTLLGGLKEYEKGARVYTAPQEREVHQALKRLCPSAERDRQMNRNILERGQQLPSLPDARNEFAQFMGGNIEWLD